MMVVGGETDILLQQRAWSLLVRADGEGPGGGT